MTEQTNWTSRLPQETGYYWIKPLLLDRVEPFIVKVVSEPYDDNGIDGTLWFILKGGKTFATYTNHDLDDRLDKYLWSERLIPPK